MAQETPLTFDFALTFRLQVLGEMQIAFDKKGEEGIQKVKDKFTPILKGVAKKHKVDTAPIGPFLEEMAGMVRRTNDNSPLQ